MRTIWLLLFIVSSAFARVPTLLISIDGLRPDSVTSQLMPNLAKFTKEGASAHLRPVFPTLTFPNHYSIVTGLYPTEHGILGNEMRDPAIEQDFRIGKPESVRNPAWWIGEPIWVSAQRQSLRAFTMFWPGSDVEIHGMRPTQWKAFDTSFTGTDRVKAVLGWFDLPVEERPDFATLYFEHVDVAEHQAGLGSPEQREALTKVDGWLGQLFEGLKTRKLRKNINVVIVSDHGMANVDSKRVIDLDPILKGFDVDVVSKGAVATLWPKAGTDLKALVAKLRAASKWMTVYTIDEIPERYHFTPSPRVSPMMLVGAEGAYIARNPTAPTGGKGHFATHGYDNELKSMEAFFAAEGPTLKTGVTLKAPVESPHVYALLAKLLEINPAERTASLKPFESFLR